MTEIPKLYCVTCPYTVGFLFRGSGQRWPQHCGRDMVRDEDRASSACTVAAEDDNPDYCTIQRTVKAWRYLACVMRFDRVADQYVIHQSMGPMARPEAEAMAQRWARAGRLEYR